jgi:hypothetical protein
VYSYILFYPILLILTRSSTTSLQSVLHVLFLPTPFKSLTNPSSGPSPTPSKQNREEILKPGALYADCSIVKVQVPTPPTTDDSSVETPNTSTTPTPSASVDKPSAVPPLSSASDQIPIDKTLAPDVDVNPKSGLTPIPDDNEYGGELVGRLTWESFEQQLKEWERANPDSTPVTHTSPSGGRGERGQGQSTPPQTAPIELEEEGADVYQ